MYKKLNLLSLTGAIVLSGCTLSNETINEEHIKNDLRASAYPLISVDPFTSGWSFTDNLYDGSVKHWTGKDFPLIGAAKVDGKIYRFMGIEELELNPIIVTSEQGKWIGKFVVSEPKGDWFGAANDYKDNDWNEAEGAFGTKENEVTAKTQWSEEFIWVRRYADINDMPNGRDVYLEYSHDDDVIIYINGKEVVNTGNACKKNVLIKLSEDVVASLKEKDNVIAAYCHNRGGNALLDFGLLVEKNDKKIFDNSAVQTSVDVQPMQTYYTFNCGPVELELKFSAPLFMDNLDLMSRPVNYLSYDVKSDDGNLHDVELYFEASPRWALDKPYQKSTSDKFSKNGLSYLCTGSEDQNILSKKGDDVRIDWGYFYMASPNENILTAVGDANMLRKGFIEGNLADAKTDGYDKLALVEKLGKNKKASGHILIGYDDISSIQYFGDNLPPYWNRNGNETIFTQFEKAEKEYSDLMAKCSEFDYTLMNNASQVGGKDYADLCALAYRQAITAHKLVLAPNNDLLFLSKENFSNGSIGTVDITYPSMPLFLIYNTDLVKGLLNHIFFYSESGKWNKPFAAHDIGTYPLGNGQTYGGDMPVEESGNMIIATAAVSAMDGNAEYAKKHWDVLTTWTDYLVENGLDPENQLCTDDFAGHFAHNTNLSIKAILGIASYGYMANMLDKKDVAAEYINKAKEMAKKWKEMADDGDHYRLTFDQENTWSQKYNLVWDKILKLGIFPEDIAKKEIEYYLTKQNVYGLPLDNRETYTKTDWIIWTATLADDKTVFEKFVAPIHKFQNETTDRVPMSDWVYTDSPKQRGFQARSVVGGYFIKMLDETLNN